MFDYRKYQREYNRRLKREILDRYGGYCYCCGETVLEFLTIDHINNDGAAHRRKASPGSNPNRPASGGVKFYHYLRKQPHMEGLRVSCHNCNSGRVRDGICPHQADLTNLTGLDILSI